MTLAFHRLAPSRLNVIGRAGEISKHSQISVRSEGKLNQRKLERSAQVGSFAFAAAFDAATQWTRQVPSNAETRSHRPVTLQSDRKMWWTGTAASDAVASKRASGSVYKVIYLQEIAHVTR